MATARNTGVRMGSSQSRGPARAAQELFDGIHHPDADVGVFFCSTEFDLPQLEKELARRFQGMTLIGCTSAGEITPMGYLNGAITGFTLAVPDFHVVATPIYGLDRFSLTDGRKIVEDLRDRLDRIAPSSGAPDTFAFLLIDGLCKCEELVLSAIAPALDDIPLFGASAGGTLDFSQSYVFADGAFHTNAAILMLVRTCHPFTVFSTDHFASSTTRMVITEADPPRRIVTEINAEPAGREYARLVGLEAEALTPMIFATHPVVVRVGGRYYTRSIRNVNDDESLTFFCAVDRGIVLTAARGTDIIENLRSTLNDIERKVGTPQIIIGCDCVLRGLELEQKQLKHQASRLFRDNNVIGFGTYGEQFHAMHLNQTFTGAAIGSLKKT